MASTATFRNGQYELSCKGLLDPMENGESLSNQELSKQIDIVMESPIDFPAIRQALAPGDQIAIALEPDVVEAPRVVAVLADWLERQGVDIAEQVTLVLAESCAFPDSLFEGIPVFRHQSGEQEGLAYLMASETADPIYIARPLIDADLTIPIESADVDDTLIPRCPSFCDRETAEEFAKQADQKKRDFVSIYNDFLGAFWTMQVVSRPGSYVKQLLVGERSAVARQAALSSHDVWDVLVEDEYEMVVVTLEEEQEQTWENAKQAILNADRVTRTKGAILLSCQLGRPPVMDWNLASNINTSQDQLATVFEQRHIYLISGLAESEAEKIGFGCIQSSLELNRLVEPYSNCFVLRDAHRVKVLLADEPQEKSVL